jgi:protein SCO1/2
MTHKNRKYKYVGLGVILLIFGGLFIPRIAQRLSKGDVVVQDRMSMVQPETLSYVVLNGERRRVPSFSFLNQDSLLTTDLDYRGKVYVAEFFFTTCPSICPIMTRNLVYLQDSFESSPDFGVASFTINPRYDTPAVLKDYAEKYGITDMDWHLLTGNQDSIYEVANAGFNIFAAEVPEVEGGFEHSGLFALIDREGFLRCRQDEFGNPIVYYRGAIPWNRKNNDQGETEQISLLKEDIKKLLDEPYGK